MSDKDNLSVTHWRWKCPPWPGSAGWTHTQLSTCKNILDLLPEEGFWKRMTEWNFVLSGILLGYFLLTLFRGIIKKKKREKSGQADRLGWPPPPLPRSGQENVKISRQVVIFGVILPFYNGQNGPKFSQNRSGQAGGRWPPPKAVSLPAFFPFFFWWFPLLAFYCKTNIWCLKSK